MEATMNDNNLPDNTIDDKALLEYYWNYFELHSNQRMQMINFYITVEVVMIGGLFTLINFDERIRFAELFLSLAISFVSLIFWGLDIRTKSLIHWCEDCMEALEMRYKDVFEQKFLLMNQSADKTKKNHAVTYSIWFNLQFLVIGIFGLIMFKILWCGTV